MEKTEDLKSIKTWPKWERPRERLIHEGAQALSDAELIAILLRSGVRGKDVVSMSRELISRFGGLRGLLSIEGKELRKVRGLGPAKAATILAATELSRRHLKEKLHKKNVIHDAPAVLDYLYGTLRDRKREVFKVLYLDKSNAVIHEQDLFHGTLDEMTIHPRELIKSALDAHAKALILVHNHPSGRSQPSQEDREITQKLRCACESVSIKVLDHLIIGDNRYFSFREEGLL